MIGRATTAGGVIAGRAGGRVIGRAGGNAAAPTPGLRYVGDGIGGIGSCLRIAGTPSLRSSGNAGFGCISTAVS